MSSQTYSISDLARELDITTRAIRFYEEQGLLSPERKGLERIYSARDKVTLKLILRGKRIGFSLAECREADRTLRPAGGNRGRLDSMLAKTIERRAGGWSRPTAGSRAVRTGTRAAEPSAASWPDAQSWEAERYHRHRDLVRSQLAGDPGGAVQQAHRVDAIAQRAGSSCEKTAPVLSFMRFRPCPCPTHVRLIEVGPHDGLPDESATIARPTSAPGRPCSPRPAWAIWERQLRLAQMDTADGRSRRSLARSSASPGSPIAPSPQPARFQDASSPA